MEVSNKRSTLEAWVPDKLRRPHPINGGKLASGCSGGRSSDTRMAALECLSTVSYVLGFLLIPKSSEWRCSPRTKHSRLREWRRQCSLRLKDLEQAGHLYLLEPSSNSGILSVAVERTLKIT